MNRDKEECRLQSKRMVMVEEESKDHGLLDTLIRLKEGISIVPTPINNKL
jgi:hypothetical protein